MIQRNMGYIYIYIYIDRCILYIYFSVGSIASPMKPLSVPAKLHLSSLAAMIHSLATQAPIFQA